MYVNGRQQVVIIIAHLVVGIIALASATYLTAAGKLDASAFTALVGAVIGLVGGSGALSHGAAIGSSSPGPSDAIVAHQADPLVGGRRRYDPPAMPYQSMPPSAGS